MKKIMLAIIFVFCLLLLPACSNGKQEGISSEDDLSYQLDLSFDPKEHTISGTETVIIRNTSSDAWDQLSFRDYPSDKRFQKKINSGITKISDISVVYSSGKKAKGNYERDEEDATILFFPLEKALKPGELVKLSFDFCTYIPKNDDRFGYSKISHSLGYFFPILSVYEDGDWINHPTFAMGECAYSECAVYDVRIDVPEGYTVITTGEEVPDKRLTFHAENVRDFTMVIGDNYDVTSTEWSGIEINSYYVRGNEEGGKKILEAAIDSMEAYSEVIGPYPYASIDYVETSFEGGALGMEYPQLVMIQEGLLSLDRNNNMDLTRLVTAHETAHQWFYGIIGNNQYEEAWIDEGFATYLENVYYEHIGELTREEMFSRLAASVNSFYDNRRLGGEALNQSYSDFTNSNAYARTVYTRGGEFLTTLRKFMGDEAFQAAVREIYENYRFEEVNTEQVLGIFRSHTKEDFTGFYQSYFIMEP